eukprot:4258292-Ditylum_brightwellii.AAC.1
MSSVTLLGNTPSDYDGSFFSGEPEGEETDRGPDHNITFLCVQLALIATQVLLYLDHLVAFCGSLYGSWLNNVEQSMSILNLGLQNVALTRGKMAPWAEEKVSTMSSMQGVHDLHKKLEEEERLKRKSKARAEKENAESERNRNKAAHILLNLAIVL